MTGNTLQPLDSSKLKITKNPSPKAPLPSDQLVFGQTFTNHMLTCKWNYQSGWASPEIIPYGPLSLDPSTCSLHYGFQLFEGMKAYRDSEDNIRLFRPERNMKRMNKSASRIALPNFDSDELIKLMTTLIDLDKEFVPSQPGYSMYLRPTLIGAGSGLSVAPPKEALLYVILSPGGPLYSTVLKSIKLEATDYAVRSWPGGYGDAKIGANYAPCVVPQLKAASRGYQQNLWLSGENKAISECGVMNIFFVLKDSTTGKKEVVTPPLDGTILEGVTRDSILDVCRTKLDPEEYEINERAITITELIERSDKGELVESFVAGTAAVVLPISEIGYHQKTINVPLLPGKDHGQLTSQVSEWMLNIQFGVEEHKNWSQIITNLKS